MSHPGPHFARYIGIDYSGAETAESSLKGLRVYMAQGNALAEEVLPPPSRHKYWTRRGIAHWLEERLSEDMPTLVGIDHAFSFPQRYYERYHLPPDWPTFLDDFQRHWPTDEPQTSVESIRKRNVGNGDARKGEPLWRRICEQRCRAKSVFHFDVQGSVAKSTHSGIPWLRYLRCQLSNSVHFWPFDGWEIPPGHSALTEVYPALWKHAYPQQNSTPDQHDAYAVASWLREADRDSRLQLALHPTLDSPHRAAAQDFEGWILGVG